MPKKSPLVLLQLLPQLSQKYGLLVQLHALLVVVVVIGRCGVWLQLELPDLSSFMRIASRHCRLLALWVVMMVQDVVSQIASTPVFKFFLDFIAQDFARWLQRFGQLCAKTVDGTGVQMFAILFEFPCWLDHLTTLSSVAFLYQGVLFEIGRITYADLDWLD